MILTGDMSRIARMINSLGNDVRNLLRTAFELSYYSRGAWSYESVLKMTPLERDIATEFVNKRLEIANKSSHPVY